MRKTIIAFGLICLVSAGFAFSDSDKPGPIRVSVLEGLGSGPLFNLLLFEDRLDVSLIREVSGDSLAETDVLLVTQQRDPESLNRSRDLIEAWVKEGGGAIFTHDAVGYRAHEPVFPLVGAGYAHPRKDTVRIAKEHCITAGMAPGRTFSPGFKYDHVIIEPGPSGETVLDNEQGESVLVAGDVGRGRVVLNGMLTGQAATRASWRGVDSEPEREERKIFIESVYWLAGAERTERKPLEAYLLEREPSIEGLITEDAAWAGISRQGGDILRTLHADFAGREAYFIIGYTPDAFFMRVKCVGQEDDRMLAGPGNQEKGLEIFLWPPGENLYRFVFGADGLKAGSRTGKSAFNGQVSNINEAWEAATGSDGKSRVAEVKIPFDVFGRIPSEGEIWKFNLGILYCPKELEEPASRPLPAEASFDDAGSFADMIFMETLPPEEEEKKEVKEGTFLYSRPGRGTFMRHGTGEKRISYAQSEISAPRLSPREDKLLYHSTLGAEDGETGIRIAHVKDEFYSVRLCAGEHARWHPSGRKIVFQREGRIFEICLDTKNEKLVSPAGWEKCKFPSYLDENLIVFAAPGRNNKWGIYSVGANGGETAPGLLLDMGEKPLSAPDFSPDGTKAAYQEGSNIYSYDLRGGEKRLLTRAPGVQSWPLWSRGGDAICYIQSPAHDRGPYDLYYLGVDDLSNVSLVTRDVHPAYGWNRFFGRIPRESLGRGKPFSVTEKGFVKAGNKWFYIELDSGTNSISIGAGEEIEICLSFYDPRGKAIPSVTEVYLNEENDRMVARAVLSGEGGKDAEVVLVLPEHSPFIEIKTGGEISGVSLKNGFDLALIPDRFASDLVIFPIPGEYSLTLPYAPVMLGFSSGRRSVFQVITPFDSQKTRLFSREYGFSGAEITADGKSLFLSLWTGADLFYRPGELIRLEDSGAVLFDFERPFQAQWRACLHGEGKNFYSAFLNAGESAGQRTYRAKIEHTGDCVFSSAIVYAYGRTAHTPLEIFTPSDVILDALGIEEAEKMLDIGGVRNFRLSRERLPHKLYSGFFPDAPIDKEEIRIADFIDDTLFSSRGGLVLGTEGSYETAYNLHNDIINILAGIEERIKQYEDFFISAGRDLIHPAGGIQKPELFNRPVARVEDIKLSEFQIRGLEGPVAGGIYRDFLEGSVIAFSERLAVLTEYRSAVQEIRRHAGVKVLRQPEKKIEYDMIRERCREVLRNRHYFEEDWRGEQTGEQVK